VPGAWNRPHIDNQRYRVRFEQRDKFVQRASRMSNRLDDPRIFLRGHERRGSAAVALR